MLAILNGLHTQVVISVLLLIVAVILYAVHNFAQAAVVLVMSLWSAAAVIWLANADEPGLVILFALAYLPLCAFASHFLYTRRSKKKSGPAWLVFTGFGLLYAQHVVARLAELYKEHGAAVSALLWSLFLAGAALTIVGIVQWFRWDDDMNWAEGT